MSGYGHRCPTCNYYSSNLQRLIDHATACAERKAAARERAKERRKKKREEGKCSKSAQ